MYMYMLVCALALSSISRMWSKTNVMNVQFGLWRLFGAHFCPSLYPYGHVHICPGFICWAGLCQKISSSHSASAAKPWGWNLTWRKVPQELSQSLILSEGVTSSFPFCRQSWTVDRCPEVMLSVLGGVCSLLPISSSVVGSRVVWKKSTPMWVEALTGDREFLSSLNTHDRNAKANHPGPVDVNFMEWATSMDASFEPNGFSGVGGVLFDSYGSCIGCFSERVSSHFAGSLHEGGSENCHLRTGGSCNCGRFGSFCRWGEGSTACSLRRQPKCTVFLHQM